MFCMRILIGEYEKWIVVCKLSRNIKNGDILIFVAFILNDHDNHKNNDNVLIYRRINFD